MSLTNQFNQKFSFREEVNLYQQLASGGFYTSSAKNRFKPVTSPIIYLKMVSATKSEITFKTIGAEYLEDYVDLLIEAMVESVRSDAKQLSKLMDKIINELNTNPSKFRKQIRKDDYFKTEQVVYVRKNFAKEKEVESSLSTWFLNSFSHFEFNYTHWTDGKSFWPKEYYEKKKIELDKWVNKRVSIIRSDNMKKKVAKSFLNKKYTFTNKEVEKKIVGMTYVEGRKRQLKIMEGI